MERKNNVTAREDVRNSERNEKIQNRNTSNTGNKMVRKGKDRQNQLHTILRWGEKAREERNSIFSRRGIRNKIMQYEAVDGRISWIRIENKQANITIINAYAPTENSKEEEKTKFYDKLEKVCEKVKRNDILMIVGDFNAKIGKEERNEGVAGKETIHDTTNDNGAKICDLAAATNTFIVSTQYRHKREHKITWMIPGGTEGNQIDHMLISKKWKRIIQDVRTYRGANVDSDHLLVVAKIRMKVVK
jgi:exonuclease III